jgi:uncharacterized protein (DUF983 family)
MRFLDTLRAFFGKRCPDCRVGPIYAAPFELHKACPNCGAVYEREPGYFVGALYVGYAFGVAFLLTVTLTLSFVFPDVDMMWLALVAIVVFLPFVPEATRYARVLWMYVDRWIWPPKSV